MCVPVLQKGGNRRGCDILAETSRAKTQRRKGRSRTSLAPSLRLDAFARDCLLVAHSRGHRGDDRVCDSSLVELLNLSGRKIEIHWRLFDTFDNSAFRKTGFNQTNNSFVVQGRRFLELGPGALATFHRRPDDAHRRRPGYVAVTLISAAATS